MDLFLQLLQGSYAYLVIFQILVVTLLLLSLIWLLVKRTRENVSRTLTATAVAVEPISPTLEQELREKIDALEKDNEGLKGSEELVKSLREKVKFLESKLLEYEILQEEIGTLSQLKVENEHLKEELIRMRPTANESTVSATGISSATPAQTPEPLAPVKPPTDEGVLQAMSEPVMATITPAVVFAAPAEAPTEEPAPSAGLEGLLKQIDELTGDEPGKTP